MGKFYRGSKPGDDWDFLGNIENDNHNFMVFEKPSCNKDGEMTGYGSIKVVLAEGERMHKGNYWLSFRYSDKYLVDSKDSKIMQEYIPELYQKVFDLLHKLYA